MPAPCSSLSAVSLLTELDAFYTEHRRCNALDGGVEGDRVWMTCTCGAVLGRRVDEEASDEAGTVRLARKR
jgi:hypothetical protein